MQTVSVSGAFKEYVDDVRNSTAVPESMFDDIDDNKIRILRYCRDILATVSRLEKECNKHMLRDSEIVPKNLTLKHPTANELLGMMSKSVTKEVTVMLDNIDTGVTVTSHEEKQNQIVEYLDEKRIHTNKLIDSILHELE